MAKMQKRYKSPKDLRRDHRNFTSHLAGNRQIEFANFDKDDAGMFNVGVEANQYSMIVRRPKGRLTFNSNLLTAGQVKFSNHDVSNHVRKNMKTRLAKRALETNTGKVHSTASESSYTGYSQATTIYDAVYNMLENYRASRKSAEHFNRKAILKNHLKDVNTTDYGYETTITWEESMDENDQNNTRSWYEKDDLEFEVNWQELRRYIYGFMNKSDIKNPLIKSIVQRHDKLLKNATTSTNDVAPIHAALTIALDFEMTAQDSFGNIPHGRVGANRSTLLKPATGNSGEHNVYNKTKLDNDLDAEIEDLTEEITNSGIDDYNTEEQANAASNNQSYFPINLNNNDSWDKNRKQKEAIENAKRLNILCRGWIMSDDRKHYPTQTNIDLGTISLDESSDTNNVSNGSTGYRPIRNSWRLPFLGDVNVFKKHPATSADLITLIDGSGSMGTHIEEMIDRWGDNYSDQEKLDMRTSSSYSNQPIDQASDMVAAIKKRFPDSKAFVFGNTDENDPTFKELMASLDDGDDRRAYRWAAGLYEIKEGKFPEFPSSGTPLCGSLKALENSFSLDHARIIIATDGDANQCQTGDPYECVYNILDSWRNKGVRIATLWTPRWEGERMPQSLHGDVTIQTTPNKQITDIQIKQVFNFIKG